MSIVRVCNESPEVEHVVWWMT